MGSEFVESDVPENGRVLRSGDGVILETTADSPDALWLTWRLPAESLPFGAVVQSVDVRICGAGQGTFWEVYGPVGGEPTEYEVEPPESDGCWHFDDAPPDDLSVLAATMLESQLRIDYVEFTVSFAN